MNLKYKLSRRAILAGLGSSTTIASIALAGPPAETTNDLGFSEDALDIFSTQLEINPDWNKTLREAAPVSADTLRSTRKESIRESRIEIGQRDAQNLSRLFKWNNNDEDTIDYWHIVSMGETVPGTNGEVTTAISDETFVLTAGVLKRMASANFFPLDGSTANRVVFALRGCKFASEIAQFGADTFAESIELQETYPDHRDYNCVIGIWDQDSDQIAAFVGSTVPLELHAALYQRLLITSPSPGWTADTNMMPQGMHWKRVDGMLGNRVPQVLRQQSLTPVQRATTGDFFSFEANWDPNWDDPVYKSGISPNPPAPPMVYDHLHCCFQPDDTLQKFSSQGCQTIRGSYTPHGNTRNGTAEWGLFQGLLGFSNPVKTGVTESGSNTYGSAQDNDRYRFMMLSGREARLHAQGADFEAMRRIRIGSKVAKTETGDTTIEKVQSFIGAGADGDFGPSSMLRLISFQRHHPGLDRKSDGVVTPAIVNLFGGATFPSEA